MEYWSTTIREPQHLTREYQLPGDARSGIIHVSLQRNMSPRELGMDLLFPRNHITEFVGFPLFEAKVKSTGPTGYASMYGWIQLYRCVDAQHPSTGGGLEAATWQMDPIPITSDLNTPFCYFGHDPTLFDGPLRLGEQDVDWIAQAFLTYLPDALLSRQVRPIAAFEWGFWIKDGDIGMKHLRELNLDAWDRHLDFMTSRFPGWRFHKHGG